MIHRLILVSSIIASAFWTASAAGQGSLRGLAEHDIQDETITVSINIDTAGEGDLASCTFEDANEYGSAIMTLLNKFGYSEMTGDANASMTLTHMKFESKTDGQRRLSRYSYSYSGSRRGKIDNGDRRLQQQIIDVFNGELSDDMNQFCQNEIKGDPENCLCKQRVVNLSTEYEIGN
jgi:hypothetical protein